MTQHDVSVSPTAADRTIGELARRLDDVAARFEALANRLDTTYLRREVFTSYRELAEAEQQRVKDSIQVGKDREADLIRRITDLEEGRRWLSRLVFGAVGTAALTLILSFGTKWPH